MSLKSCWDYFVLKKNEPCDYCLGFIEKKKVGERFDPKKCNCADDSKEIFEVVCVFKSGLVSCGKSYKFNILERTTTGMLNHLRRKHNTNHKKEEVKPKRDIRKYMEMSKTIRLDTHLNKYVNQELLLFITSSGLPFNVVNNKHLRNALVFANPEVRIGSDSYFRNELLPIMYKEQSFEIMNRVSTLVEFSPFVALTTDEMSKFKTSFTAVTGHFFDFNLNLLSLVLTIKENDGKCIVQDIKEVQTKYHLNNIVMITTDGAKNNISAVNYLSLGWSHCIVHLVIGDVVKSDQNFRNVLLKMNKIQRFYSISIFGSKELEGLCAINKESQCALCSYCKTRFGSISKMISSFVSKEKSLKSCLSCETVLTVGEWDSIRDKLLIFKLISTMSEILSGENKPTKCLVVPCLKIIREKIVEWKTNGRMVEEEQFCFETGLPETVQTETFNDNYEEVEEEAEEEAEEGIELMDCEILEGNWIQILEESFNKRTGLLLDDKYNLIATYLNPIYKNYYLTTAEKLFCRESLINLIKARVGEPKIVTKKYEQNLQTNPQFKYMKIKEVVVEKECDEVIDIKKELEGYDKVETNLDLQNFWLDVNNRKCYPILFKYVLKFEIIPASSIACERVFSRINNIFSEKRSKTSSNLIVKQAFLK